MLMPIVIDASATACWALQDEDDPLAVAASWRAKVAVIQSPGTT